jgi:hypothetical protein
MNAFQQICGVQAGKYWFDATACGSNNLLQANITSTFANLLQAILHRNHKLDTTLLTTVAGALVAMHKISSPQEVSKLLLDAIKVLLMEGKLLIHFKSEKSAYLQQRAANFLCDLLFQQVEDSSFIDSVTLSLCTMLCNSDENSSDSQVENRGASYVLSRIGETGGNNLVHYFPLLWTLATSSLVEFSNNGLPTEFPATERKIICCLRLLTAIMPTLSSKLYNKVLRK